MITLNGLTGITTPAETVSGTGVWSVGGTQLYKDASGNLGLGVTPSGWGAGYKAFESNGVALMSAPATAGGWLIENAYYNGSSFIYKQTAGAAMYRQLASEHTWWNAASGAAGTGFSFTQAMTLDASGNLLVGVSSNTGWGGASRISKATSEGNTVLVVDSQGADASVYILGVASNAGWSASGTGMRVGKNSSTNRSINAAGTVNASGADYAEYMTKAGDFVIAKGDVCGVDANGLLTNVFSEAISFVVKSTDPSYVGNDSWGAGLKDANVLEAERQKVDRIAFAGQVPVNVFGAKVGDYIIPVSDADGIKGEAVSNPTFEQYQIAVGKVIAIETDGRAKIIVKVT